MIKKYNCLIADDSMLDRDVLEMYIAKMENLHIVAVCKNGLEAAAVLKEHNIDIVFSDIDMPDISGIELKQSLQLPPLFIFISAYAEHAAESYNIDVVDFIVKPVTLARLLKATDKAVEYIKFKNTEAATSFKGEVNESDYFKEDHFFIKEDNGYTKINMNDLLFVESMGNFSRLQTLHGSKHVTLVSLKNMEARLPEKIFMRVHKQYIVNLQQIKSLNSDGDIQLTGDNFIPIGSSYKAALLNIINKTIILR